MSDTTYKIGVEITGDDSRFRATAKSSEKAVSDLGKTAGSALGSVVTKINDVSARMSNFGEASKLSGGVFSGAFLGSMTGALASKATSFITSLPGQIKDVGEAIFDISKNAANFSASFASAAAKTSLSVETLSSIKFLTGDVDNFTGAFLKLEKKISDAADGSKEAQQGFLKLGFSLKDIAEGAKNPEKALDMFLEKFKQVPPGAQRAQLAMAVFGKGGAELIPVFNKLASSTEGFRAQADKLGGQLSGADADAAKQFKGALALIDRQVEILKVRFGNEFVPTVTQGLKYVSATIANNQQAVRDWGRALAQFLVSAARTTYDTLKGMGAAWDAFQWTVNKNLDLITLGTLDNAQKASVWATSWEVAGHAVLNAITPALDAFRELGKFQSSTKYSLAEKPEMAGPMVAEAFSNAMTNRKMEQLLKSTGSAELGAGVSKGAAKSSSGGGKMNFEMSSKGKALVEAANKLGINPLDLAAIISYETSGTFNPSIKGGKGNNYQGLIQFGQEERSTYRVTKGQSFEQQILGPVVKYFQDRFASVGKSTVGATLLDLYKTVNGGNPTVSANASDGNGTISQHVQRIASQHKSNALKYFFGGNSKNVKGLDGAEIAKRENDEFERGAALVKQYDDQVKNLGVTTERRKVDLILETGEYAKLSEAQKQKIRDDADAIDSYTKEAQASENYSAFVKSLLDDYGALNNVQPTATEQLNKYIAANKEAGVIMDESDIATVKRIATLFDLAKAQEKENDLVQVETQRYRDERDAIWETVAAQQALTNEINRATLKPEQNFGVKNPNPGIADDDPTPKFKRTISANAMANATGRDFAAGGIFDQNTVDTQVSLMATLKETGMDTFKALAGEIGNAAAQWIAYGGASEQSLGQATKAVLASVSAQALGTGLYELGIGFAALTPWGAAIYGPAPLHFKSAAILLGMGAALGGIARAIPGGSKSSQSSSPDYQTTNSNYQNTSLNESNRKMVNSPDTQFSQLSQSVNNLNTTVDALHSKISSMKASDVVTKGFEQKPGLASQAVTKDLRRNGTQKTEMGKALGLK